MATRQQLEQQLVAAHRSGNVQAAQQAAYAIRQYDQSALSAQVPSVNAPPPIERVPKPTFGSWLENVSIGIGDEWGRQIQGLGESVQRGVSAFAKDPLKASAAAFMTALEPARQGFTQPVQTAKGIGTGIAETVGQMGRQAASGPIGFGQVVGQVVDMPGPDLPGGKRRPTMAELDVYHGTPHTFEPEEGAPLGRFRSSKIGTGEGAQAYGYGLYFAESPDVAGQYAKMYSPSAPNQKSLMRLRDAAPSGSAEWKHYDDLIKNGMGRTYTVDLPDAKIEQMLDWDKPLSEQPKAVQDVLASSDLTGTAGYLARTPEKTTAGELYKALSNSYGQKEVSEYFRKGGIPGIKYLDAGSRDGGKGTRNFVVFPGEEQHLTILERDGVKAEVPKPKTPSFTDALNNLVRPDLEDDQVFSKPLPPADADNLDYVGKFGASSTGTGGMHVSVRDGIKNAGPHEFFFYDNNDEPLGFARLTKNKKQASINMIAFNEEGRGRGFGKSFYKYLLDDLGVEVKSDKEITQGTAGIYESLAKEYPTRVDDDGRVVISPKSK